MYEWHISSRLIRSLSIIFLVGGVESQGGFCCCCSCYCSLALLWLLRSLQGGGKSSMFPEKVGISSVFRSPWSQGINPAVECGRQWCSISVRSQCYPLQPDAASRAAGICGGGVSWGKLAAVFALPVMVTGRLSGLPSVSLSDPGVSCRGYLSLRERIFL